MDKDNLVDLDKWRRKEDTIRDCTCLAISEAKENKVSLQEFISLVISLWDENRKM